MTENVGIITELTYIFSVIKKFRQWLKKTSLQSKPVNFRARITHLKLSEAKAAETYQVKNSNNISMKNEIKLRLQITEPMC